MSNSWQEIHERYNELWKRYRMEKLRHAYYSLMFLYKDETDTLTPEMWNECQTQRSPEGPRHLHRIPRLSEAPWEVP